MNLLLVVNNLSGGGAEKVAVDLSNEFSKDHNVKVLTLSNKKDKYVLNPSISRVKLELNSKSNHLMVGLINNVKRIISLRKVILESKPDHVITFMNRTNIRVLISLIGTNIPVIITEHNYPKSNKMSFIWELLRRILYHRCKYLVSVSDGVSNCFNYIPQYKRKVIYNPIELNFDDSDDFKLDPNRKNITAIGRLVRIKGFDILIEAFSKIYLKYPEWDLNIIGDGPLKEKLQNQIDCCSLSKRVRLLGYKNKPHTILKDSDLFVLSSRSEGLGNVILEAMQCNVPVLSTDCPVGPKEIIMNNYNGVLVESEDVVKLKEGLELMISDPDFRKKLTLNAIVTLDKFSNSVIFGNWNELINDKEVI